MSGLEQTGGSVWSEEISRAFHDHYEALAPYFGYKTREASAVRWEDVPQQNRDLMMATVSRLLSDCVILPGPQLDRQGGDDG